MVLAEDLSHMDLHDICGGLADIAKYPRRDGETAFPELPTLKNAIIERKILRQADDDRRQEAEEEKYRSEHPEEFISAKEFWGAEDVRAIMAKARKL